MPVKLTKLTQDQEDFIARERSQFKVGHPTYFVKYRRLDRPVTHPEALLVGLRVTKAMYRKLQGELEGVRNSAEFQTNKAGRLETLLQRAITALTSPTENVDAKLVIRDYMEELRTGYHPPVMSMEQSSVTLDQWGDVARIADRPGEYDLRQTLSGKLLARAKAKQNISRLYKAHPKGKR